jgi:hypothetical protein
MGFIDLFFVMFQYVCMQVALCAQARMRACVDIASGWSIKEVFEWSWDCTQQRKEVPS